MADGFCATIARRDGAPVWRYLVGCKRLDCPRCGRRVAEREAANIGCAVTEHYARGGSVAFVTLTMRHVRAQALVGLLCDLMKAWTSCRTCREPRSFWSACSVGFVRKLEVTYGRNGWHPHLHLLVFLRPTVGEREAAALFGSVFGVWSRRLVALGAGEPSAERGLSWELLDLDVAHERVAAYIAKDAGRELASAGTKRGRGGSWTSFDLLAAGAAGDARRGLLYLEYEDAMRGLSRIQWSSGLRAELVSDLAEDVDEDAEGADIAVFSADAMFVLRYNERSGLGPGLGQLLQWAGAYDDDAEAFDLICRQCERWGIPPPDPPRRLREDLAALRLQLEPCEYLRLF